MTVIGQKLRKGIYDVLKSPGTHFMAGNALANAETTPWIAAVYASAFCAQAKTRSATNSGESLTSPTLKFLAGEQGGLATNALITFGVGITTLALGAHPLLGGAMLAFSTANMSQALIYGGKLKFKKPMHKNFALAACEVGMIGGFALLGAHVGLGVAALATIAGVGVSFAAIRSFRPKALHPDLAYADMLLTAGCTMVQAVATHNYTLAASRVMAMMGISRLAVLRAKNDGKTSIFAVEERLPRFISRTRQALAQLVAA